jgi:hypothetical protein
VWSRGRQNQWSKGLDTSGFASRRTRRFAFDCFAAACACSTRAAAGFCEVVDWVKESPLRRYESGRSATRFRARKTLSSAWHKRTADPQIPECRKKMLSLRCASFLPLQ